LERKIRGKSETLSLFLGSAGNDDAGDVTAIFLI